MHNNSHNILDLEFNYAKDTAAQAINDRYTMLNFYVGLIAAVSAITTNFLLATAYSQSYLVLSPLLIISGLVGWIFLAIMIRLRQACLSSLESMNTIKAAYAAADNSLDSAFVWTNNTLPSAYKPWSIHYFSSLLISLLSSLSLATGIGFFFYGYERRGLALLASIVCFTGNLLLQAYIYRKALLGNK